MYYSIPYLFIIFENSYLNISNEERYLNSVRRPLVLCTLMVYALKGVSTTAFDTTMKFGWKIPKICMNLKEFGPIPEKFGPIPENVIDWGVVVIDLNWVENLPKMEFTAPYY